MHKWLFFLTMSILLASCGQSEVPMPDHALVPTPTLTTQPLPIVDSSPTPRASLTPAPFPLMPTYIIDAVFPDRIHGWLVGTATLGESLLYSMASTLDGGVTWNAIPIPNVEPRYDPEQQGGIFFADKNTGWFFFSGLFSTNDGGLTWVEEHPQGTIEKIEQSANGTIWALEQADEDWVLWKVSSSSYETWQASNAEFPVNPANAQLEIADDQHAWLAYRNSDGHGEYVSHILATQDGGQNWVEIHSPCNEFATYGGILAVVDSRNLWLGCGWPLGAGSGTKYVFFSPDGGYSWAMRGRGDAPSDNTLSTMGYFDDIGAVSPSFAYMTWSRTLMVIITRDGGTTWEYSPLKCSMEHSRAVFLDPMMGWAFDQDCINRTVNGGKTWECTVLPDNRPCLP